jgi:hypothetical protein
VVLAGYFPGRCQDRSCQRQSYGSQAWFERAVEVAVEEIQARQARKGDMIAQWGQFPPMATPWQHYFGSHEEGRQRWRNHG